MFSILASHLIPLAVSGCTALLAAIIRKWEKSHLNEQQQKAVDEVLNSIKTSGLSDIAKNEVTTIIQNNLKK